MNSERSMRPDFPQGGRQLVLAGIRGETSTTAGACRACRQGVLVERDRGRRGAVAEPRGHVGAEPAVDLLGAHRPDR